MSSIGFRYLSFVSIITIISFVQCDDEVWQWTSELYPNITSPKEAVFCTRPYRVPPTSICDPDNILSKKHANSLDILINDARNDTKCLCDMCPPSKRGLNIKVALVKFIKVFGNVSVDRSVEIFAERTRRKWHFGEECSNDVLIFFAALDDKIHISMGSRVKRIISQEDIEAVLQKTREHFTSGYYHQGLESIIASLEDLADNHTTKPPRLSTGSIILIVICVIIAVIMISSLLYFFCVKKGSSSSTSSFEFIGSWGRNRKNKVPKRVATPTATVRHKVEHIYQPVRTQEKIDSGDSTLPLTEKHQIV